MKLKKKHYMLIALVGIVLIWSLFQEPKIHTIPGGWNVSEGFEQYLVEEPDFDYTHPSIYSLAQTIKSQTSTPKEAIKQTIKYVVQNIRYSSAITINDCFEEKASDVLESGIGDCVSMSRLVTALLRAQGIPARTVGGCLSSYRRCRVLFATVPFLEAQVTEMVEEDFKKRGYLHEWVEAFDGEKWVLIEATSGQVFPVSCYDEAYLKYSYDSNQMNRCVITSRNFWSQCKIF